jgi:hypothetical protein
MPVAVIPALAAAVLGEEALRLAIQPVMAEIGVQLSYAMGWVADNFRGDRGKEAAAMATLHASPQSSSAAEAAVQLSPQNTVIDWQRHCCRARGDHTVHGAEARLLSCAGGSRGSCC